MLIDHLDYFRTKPVNLPKITILLDHGYHLDTIQMALELFYPRIMTKVRFQLAPKPTQAEKCETTITLSTQQSQILSNK